jgi:nucleoside-diphosphate-sugar epimerase
LAAVTGATGFVGRRLLPVLAARGWRLRILARRPPEPGWADWAAPGAAPEVTTGDLDDDDALAALTQGADVVVHGAGLIKAAGWSDFAAVNIRGAERVARRTGAARMVLISSLAAREPTLSDYAATKRAGEAAARAVLGDRLTILRPPAIYGPGDRETLALFQLAAASPVAPLPGPETARLALAYVDDVAAVIASRMEGAWAPGTWAIGGARPEGYAWREIFNTAAAAVGRSPRLIRTPPWLIRGGAALSAAVGRLRGVPSIFTPGKARELLHPDWSVTDAEQPPGAAPAWTDLAAGFARTVAWYRREGWLSPP